MQANKDDLNMKAGDEIQVVASLQSDAASHDAWWNG
jgi:hypothetical protein